LLLELIVVLRNHLPSAIPPHWLQPLFVGTRNYDLRFYSVSGTNATLMTNYTAGPITFHKGT
jgi:hypothetical protein